MTTLFARRWNEAGDGTGQAQRVLPSRRRTARRVLLSLIALVILLAGGLVGRIAWSPIEIEGLSTRIEAALSERVGKGWDVGVASAAIDYTRYGPTLRVSGIDIRNAEGASVLKAKAGEISLSFLGLLVGRMSPSAVVFSGLDLRLNVSQSGELSFAATDEEPAPSPAEPQGQQAWPPVVAEGEAQEQLPLAAAVVSLVDLITDRDTLFGSIDHFGLSDARLVIVDAQRRPRARFGDVSLQFNRKTGLTRFNFGLRGEHGPWSVSGVVRGEHNGTREAQLHVTRAPVSDLLLFGGMSHSLVTTRMPLSGEVSLAVDGEGHLRALDASLNGDAAIIYIDDPDQPPIDVDDVGLRLSWNPETRAFDVPSASLTAGETRINLTGRLSAGEGPDVPWQLDVAGKAAVIERLTGAEEPLTIDDIAAEIVGGEAGGVIVRRLSVTGQHFAVVLSGSAGTPDDRGGVRVSLTSTESDARALLRLWPAFVASGVRRYLIDNMRAGTVHELSVNVNLDAEELVASRQKKPLPPETVDVRFRMTGVDLLPTKGLPVLRDTAARGTVDGNSVSVYLPRSEAVLEGGRKLALSEGFFAVADLRRPAQALISLRIQGGADAVLALVRSDAIRERMEVDLDPARVTGNADLRLELSLPLIDELKAEDVRAEASGELTNLGVTGIAGDKSLEKGRFALTLDGDLLTLDGEGRFADLPATVTLRQPLAGAEGQAAIRLTVDDAARARLGFDLGRKLTGPVTVTADLSLGDTARQPKSIGIDFTRAAINEPLPGWTKPAGREASLTFNLVEKDDGFVLEKLALDGAGMSVKGGRVVLRGDGSFTEAEFSQIKISPGDDVRLQVARVRDGYKATVRGNVLDARPFLRKVFARGGSNDALDIDLDVAVDILGGFNSEIVSKAVLKLAMRNGNVTGLAFSGSFGRSPVTASLSRGGGGETYTVVQTADAGAALRFVDIYQRMAGGQLVLQWPPANGNAAGILNIRDFSLVDEPALRRIVSAQPREGERVTVNDVPFTKLKVDFTRAGGRINMREAVIWGPQVGISLEGHLDLTNETLDLSGTYVPAYALNNIFSQLPVIGLLLGGGQYEGLFAVNFRVRGPMSGPTMTINPLSAIAPGFLRKFFDAGRADSGQGGTDPFPPVPANPQ